jgi:hypothetical protein
LNRKLTRRPLQFLTIFDGFRVVWTKTELHHSRGGEHLTERNDDEEDLIDTARFSVLERSPSFGYASLFSGVRVMPVSVERID